MIKKKIKKISNDNGKGSSLYNKNCHVQWFLYQFSKNIFFGISETDSVRFLSLHLVKEKFTQDGSLVKGFIFSKCIQPRILFVVT